MPALSPERKRELQNILYGNPVEQVSNKNSGDDRRQKLRNILYGKNPVEYNQLTKTSPGWRGVGEDILRSGKEFGQEALDVITNPSRIAHAAKEFAPEAMGAVLQAVSEPERFTKNIAAGLGSLGKGIINTPGNVSEYLANKGVIETRIPKMPDYDYSEMLGVGNEPGDKLISGASELAPYILGGELGLVGKNLGRKVVQRSGALSAHAVGQNQNPVKAALMVPTAELGLRGTPLAIKGAKKITEELKPSTLTARHFGGDLSAEELLRNLEATKGTKTSLGRVLQSPGLSKTYENITSEIPLSGGKKTLSETARKLSDKASKLFPSTSITDEELHNLLLKAKKEQNVLKNKMFKPVSELSEKEGFKLELPNSAKLARQNMKAIEESPLYRTDSKFRESANKLFGLSNLESPRVDASGKRVSSYHPSIVEARMFATDLINTGKRMIKSPNSIDQYQGKMYINMGQTTRNEIRSQIKSKGSEALQKADSEAMVNFNKNYLPFLDQDLHKLLSSGELSETFVRDVIRPGKSADKYKRLQKVNNLLPEGKKNVLGESYLSKAIDEEGNVDPRAIMKQYNTLGKRQKNVLFDKERQKQILDFEKLMELNPDAMNYMFNPMTGYRGKSGLGYFLPALGGYKMGAGLLGFDPTTAAAVFGTQSLAARGFNKLMTHEPFREKVVKKKIDLEKAKTTD